MSKLTTPHFLLIFQCLIGLTACATSEAQSTVRADGSRIEKINSAFDIVDDGPILIVAHRGCWSAAPENSVAAMKACIHLGVEAVEIDVQLTKDNELVVFHDQTVDRMTGAEGYVKEMSLAELRELRLYERDGSPAQIMDKKLPTRHLVATLEEIFSAANGQLMINLEIKSNDVHSFEEVFYAAVALSKEMGVEDHVFWKIPAATREFHLPIVKDYAGGTGPDTPADLIVNALKTDGLTYITPILWKSDRPFADQLDDFSDNTTTSFEIVTTDLDFWPLAEDGRIIGADRYRYMGIAVLPRWSGGLSDDLALQDPDAAWGRLIDLGADLIMTDRPEQLIQYLKETGRR